MIRVTQIKIIWINVCELVFLSNVRCKRVEAQQTFHEKQLLSEGWSRTQLNQLKTKNSFKIIKKEL